MALNNKQRLFIKSKVKKLGSLERIREFYKRDDLVCEYAKKIAEKLWRY